MSEKNIAIGKLPPELLKKLLQQAPILDDRILSGPGIGIDCAVIKMGEKALAVKTDPITFVSDEIGWYAVQVCANDIVTTGSKPLWYLATVLLPEKSTTQTMVEEIGNQIYETCAGLGISVIGGHTEVTTGLDRPIVVGTMIGEVEYDHLLSPADSNPGDHVLLTKGVPIETTAIIAREFKDRLLGTLNQEEIEVAARYLYDPGISVIKDAQIALDAGVVHAMHDPTEGGLAAALWEMSDACGHGIVFDPDSVYIPELARKVCDVFGIDPLASIASGALLMSVPDDNLDQICTALSESGIHCADIGRVVDENHGLVTIVNGKEKVYPRPERDEIATLFDSI